MDFGPRRIGLAISDESGTIARPLRGLAVPRVREAPEAVAAVAREERAHLIVVGMPEGLAGEEARPEGRRVLRFVKALRAAAGIPIHLEDESMSSREAREIAGGAWKRPTRRAAQEEHARAAAIILQRWLDTHAEGRGAAE